MITICAISDMHGYLPDDLPECDLLLIAGDVTPIWDHKVPYQTTWLKEHFDNWLKAQKAKQIVGIAGNHDFALKEDLMLGHKLSWTYLRNETTTVTIGDESLKIFGTPYSVRFGSWAFMLPDHQLSETIWEKMPNDIDILLTHGPMFGYGDTTEGYTMTKTGWEKGNKVGSVSLRNHLEYGKQERNAYPDLKLLVCGHIHEAYGTYPINDTLICYNVSRVNVNIEPVNDPVVIKINGTRTE